MARRPNRKPDTRHLTCRPPRLYRALMKKGEVRSDRVSGECVGSHKTPAFLKATHLKEVEKRPILTEMDVQPIIFASLGACGKGM